MTAFLNHFIEKKELIPRVLPQDYSMTEDKKPGSEKKQELEIIALVEAILFVSPEPLSADQIANILETTPRLVKKAVEEIDLILRAKITDADR